MQYLSDYKALLFDIDRTLIPPTREIYPEVIDIIKKLAKRGIITGVCSGRGYASIVNAIIPIFPENSLHILAGGSLVISNSGNIVWQESIDAQTLTSLQQLILDTNSVAIFMKPDGQYAHGKVLENIKKHPWNQIGKKLHEMKPDGVGLVYVAKPNEQIKAFVHNHPNLSYKDMQSNNGYQYYDISAKGVTKAKALKEWSKATAIPTSEIIGFGDSTNDLEFLQNCGYSIAMGNADDEIKSIVNKTIGDVTQKGLPIYVETILKGDPL